MLNVCGPRQDIIGKKLSIDYSLSPKNINVVGFYDPDVH